MNRKKFQFLVEDFPEIPDVLSRHPALLKKGAEQVSALHRVKVQVVDGEFLDSPLANQIDANNRKRQTLFAVFRSRLFQRLKVQEVPTSNARLSSSDSSSGGGTPVWQELQDWQGPGLDRLERLVVMETHHHRDTSYPSKTLHPKPASGVSLTIWKVKDGGNLQDQVLSLEAEARAHLHEELSCEGVDS